MALVPALFLWLAQAAPAPGVAAPAEPAPLEVEDVDEVIVVTGTRTERKREDSTALVSVIDRAQLEASGAETIAAVLEAQPGIELEPGLRGFNIRMQGLDPEYVLILVDGERAQGRLGGGLDLTRFPAESVERIEIVKGAGSALYGADAVAGVINIITRRPREAVEFGGHLSGGGLGSLDTSGRLGLRRKKFEVLGILGHHRGEGYDLNPSTPDTTASAFQSTDATLSGGYWATGILRIGAKAEYVYRLQEGVGSNPAGALFDRKTQSEQASITVEPDWRFAGGSRLRLTAHHSFYEDQFLSDQRGSDALDRPSARAAAACNTTWSSIPITS
jgi:outer membrane receptor for ferrienterochelin and colicins